MRARRRCRVRPVPLATSAVGRVLLSAVVALGALCGVPSEGRAQSLRLLQSAPTAYDFVDIPRVPEGFGAAEFTLDLWIKPDDSFPVGEVWPPSYGQLTNWAIEDDRPYSSDMWWVSGNWLLDGHTRPHGYGPGDSRAGTFSLQFYGGGRLRFMFADDSEAMPRGGVYAVQAPHTERAPSLLDGRWHHVLVVRRWREPSGATLELWIDGEMVGATDIPMRTDMRRYWSHLAHPDDPAELGGWALGSEVMTAWNYAVTQFEDYKGLVDDLRFWGEALTPSAIQSLSAGQPPADVQPLAWFGFDEGEGYLIRDRLDPTFALSLHRPKSNSWSAEDSPASVSGDA